MFFICSTKETIYIDVCVHTHIYTLSGVVCAFVYVYVCLCGRGHTQHGAMAPIWRSEDDLLTYRNFGSLFVAYRSLGWNSGHQTQWQEPLSVQTSYWILGKFVLGFVWDRVSPWRPDLLVTPRDSVALMLGSKILSLFRSWFRSPCC